MVVEFYILHSMLYASMLLSQFYVYCCTLWNIFAKLEGYYDYKSFLVFPLLAISQSIAESKAQQTS